LRLGTGGVGVWWGLTIGLAAASLGLTYLFRRRLRHANSMAVSR
jgi:LPXTG-motif cell wall-anchored protein